MSTNIFLKAPEDYKQDLQPVRHYVRQMGFYLSVMTDKPLEHCKSFVASSLKSGSLPGLRNPIVKHFERDNNGDRTVQQTPLLNYIGDTIRGAEVLAPTFTTYMSVEQRPSLLVGFVDENKTMRGVIKKQAAAAKARGEIEKSIILNNEQDNRKRQNNSVSGSFGSGGTVLHNPTAHSTLTTITRTITSLGNASNERLIAGNRHYRNPDVTLYNLITIASDYNQSLWKTVIEQFGLHVPSVQETMDCVRYSTDLYWVDRDASADLEGFVSRIHPHARAAIVYTGDMYHLRKHNDALVRRLIKSLSTKDTQSQPNEPLSVIKATDEATLNYVQQICMSEVKGIGKRHDSLSIDKQHIVAATCLNVQRVVGEYKELFEALFLHSFLPVSSAYLSDMIRRAVVLSDTDSTMFSCDEWILWYFGKLSFTDEDFAVAGAIMFLASQTIAHSLAQFSANIGVTRSKIFDAQMKPEFVFPVFVQAPVAKHYYTCIAVKEGDVYKEVEKEIKGVHLKSSAVPKELVAAAQERMVEIMETVRRGEKISILAGLRRVADIERSIIASIKASEVRYFTKQTIKSSQAYAKDAEESPYQHYLFWQEVMQPKYGTIEEPPFDVIKIPLTTANSTMLQAWLSTITDEPMRQRLTTWFARTQKTYLKTTYISSSFVQGFGMPSEFVPIVDTKRIVLDLTRIERMILESLGYFPKSGVMISEAGF